VINGLGRPSIPFAPVTGTEVQLPDRFWRPLRSQEISKQVGEQVMVAMPVVFIVQRQGEQVALPEMGQHSLPIIFTRNGIAQRLT
jgi:hypothetical protein